MPRNPSTPEPRLAELHAQLAAIGPVLPGTINIATNRCGKPNCACHADPPRLHGPYVTWTRKVNGKTVTRRLTPEQLKRYQPWFENNRRLRQLITELEALSLRTAEQAEGWQPHRPTDTDRPATEQSRPNSPDTSSPHAHAWQPRRNADTAPPKTGPKRGQQAPNP